jgi:hypothetical protein
MYNYILVGNNSMAVAIKSELLLLELQDLVRSRSKKVHPKSYESVFRLGVIEFINPEVMLPSDFCNRFPYILSN